MPSADSFGDSRTNDLLKRSELMHLVVIAELFLPIRSNCAKPLDKFPERFSAEIFEFRLWLDLVEKCDEAVAERTVCCSPRGLLLLGHDCNRGLEEHLSNFG